MFKVNAFLADAAQVAAGKLFALGAGWSTIVPGAPFAVCGKVDIPWHQATDWHTLKLELLDGDGDPMLVPTEESEEGEPLDLEMPPYRAPIAPHVKPGTSLDWTFAVNVGPGLPLLPGEIYVWRISIDGKSEDGWTLPFSTVAASELQQAA